MRAFILFFCFASCCLGFLFVTPLPFAPAIQKDDKKDPKKDAIFAAEMICLSWFNEKHPSYKAMMSLKLTKEMAAADFKAIRVVAKDSTHIPKEVRKVLNEEDSKGNEAERLYAREYFIALWFEWRVMNEKSLEDALKASTNLVKVRFKSKPTGAKVIINGVHRGTTEYQVALNKTHTYDISIQKDGFKSEEKKGFTPNAAEPGLEVELVPEKK